MKNRYIKSAFRAALLTGLLGTISCVEVQNLRDELAIMQQDVTRLRDQSKLGWRTTLCSRDARLLLAAVQKECESGACDLEIPPQSVVQMSVCHRDPKRRERFLDILSHQEKEVFYLYSNTKELSQESRDRLRELVTEAKPLPTTRFLVVSRPWDREPEKRKHAEERGQIVIRSILQLLAENFKSDQAATESTAPISVLRKTRTLLWVYEFPLKPWMRTKTLPQSLVLSKPFENWTNANSDAPVDDERGVWVFRVDC